jgi:hypothetical protein
VTPLTGLSYLLKAGFAEGFDKAHEAIARGIRIDRVGFHYGRAIARGMINGCQKQLFRDPVAAMLSLNEEARQRPDSFRRFKIIKAPEMAVGVPRRDRTPGDGGAVTIAENADRHAGLDLGLHRSPAACAIALFSFRSRRSPDHAPAALWSASAFEEVGEIGPIFMAYFPKDEFAQVSNSSPSVTCIWRNAGRRWIPFRTIA